MLRSVTILALLAFVLFLSLGSIRASKEVQEAIKNDSSKNITLEEYCLKETNFSKKELEKYEDDADKEPTEDYYCYSLCLLTTLGVIDENGTFIFDEFKKNLSEEVEDVECFKKIPKITECSDMAYLDECD